MSRNCFIKVLTFFGSAITAKKNADVVNNVFHYASVVVCLLPIRFIRCQKRKKKGLKSRFWSEHSHGKTIPDAFLKNYCFSNNYFSGKPYADMALKVLLVTILQSFKIEADGKFEDIKLKQDISVRIKDDRYPIRLARRWNIFCRYLYKWIMWIS